MWRIRIYLADDPQSRARLDEVLSRQRVVTTELTPRAGFPHELSGDVVLELPRDEELGDMLAGLHLISPQVFVSKVDSADHGTSLDAAVATMAPPKNAKLAGLT